MATLLPSVRNCSSCSLIASCNAHSHLSTTTTAGALHESPSLYHRSCSRTQPMYQLASLPLHERAHLIVRAGSRRCARMYLGGFFIGAARWGNQCRKWGRTLLSSEHRVASPRGAADQLSGGRRVQEEQTRERKREDAEPCRSRSCSFTSSQCNRRIPPVTFNVLKLTIAPFVALLCPVRLPWLVRQPAVLSSCAPSSSCSLYPADRCQTARRCAQCFSLCTRAPNGSPKTRCQVTHQLQA